MLGHALRLLSFDFISRVGKSTPPALERIPFYVPFNDDRPHCYTTHYQVQCCHGDRILYSSPLTRTDHRTSDVNFTLCQQLIRICTHIPFGLGWCFIDPLLDSLSYSPLLWRPVAIQYFPVPDESRSSTGPFGQSDRLGIF